MFLVYAVISILVAEDYHRFSGSGSKDVRDLSLDSRYDGEYGSLVLAQVIDGVRNPAPVLDAFGVVLSEQLAVELPQVTDSYAVGMIQEESVQRPFQRVEMDKYATVLRYQPGVGKTQADRSA